MALRWQKMLAHWSQCQVPQQVEAQSCSTVQSPRSSSQTCHSFQNHFEVGTWLGEQQPPVGLIRQWCRFLHEALQGKQRMALRTRSSKGSRCGENSPSK
uniref:Uncharacterized protein n=1 Tax=Arundo donax TaxID=35708 RepID=A0A0A9G5C8_ARUDO